MPKVAAPSKSPKENVPESDWRALSFGLWSVFIFAGGLALIMFGLKHYDGVNDPDAQTLVIAPDYPRHLINFSLTDQSGHPVTRADLNGKIVVVNFVFTSCSIICPVVNAQMAKIQKLTADQPDVRLLSLTLDPADDTAPVLADYGHRFGQDASRWSFLTGDVAVMRGLIGTSFLASDSTGQFATMPGNFANSQRIVLVDPKGQVVEYFDGLNAGASDAVVEAIKKLRRAM